MEALAPERRLAGRYVLKELIAAGGMAFVWQALDEVLARTVAVKVLRHDLGEDPTFAQRFQAEAVAAARLTHPNIISIFDTGDEEGLRYIVMEYFAGSTLADLMQARGQTDPDEAIGLILPVLSALALAHSHGLIHRDIKPGNVLVGEDGRVKVTDFGIAKAAFGDLDLTTTGAVLGTVRYLSPEQVQGDRIDARSDLYSLGVVLYEMLTGRPPFVAETDVATAMMRLTQNPTAPRDIRPEISRSLEAVMIRALERDPDDRYSSAEAMRSALERAAPGRGAARTQALPPIAGQPGRRWAAGGWRGGDERTDRPEGRAASQIPAGSAFRSWMLIPLIVIVVAGVAIALGVALGRLQFGGPLGIRGAPAASGGQTGGTAATPVRITGSKDFDPQGSDHSEHPDEVHLAFDGKSSTAWTTDHYSSPQFGQLKHGLGLWVSLGKDAEVQQVTVDSPITGWRFQIQSGPLDHLSDPLRSTDGGTTFEMEPSGQTVIHLQPVKTSALLVWIIELGPDGGRFAAAISEISVLGKPA